MKIKVIIVDDEMHARSFLRKFCERYHSDTIDVLEECSSVESAVRVIKRYQPDLIFLDIQMPDENGFELLKYFDKINFEIIKKSALDYLVKPFSTEDFNIAISRYISKKNIKIDFDRFKLLTENINNQFTDKHRIVFPTKSGFEVIQANSIVYCKSDGSYSNIITIDKEYFTSKSLKEINDIIIDSNFIRIHKSYIVNKNYIKSFKSDEFKLDLITGDVIPVSDTLFSKKKLIDAISS